MQDGNIAFKVIWVYGEQGPFSTPCTPEGREINIVQDKKIWCQQTTCNCNIIYNRKGNAGSYWDYHDMNVLDEWPCYDSMIFNRWEFGGGMGHGKTNTDAEKSIKFWKRGKLAFFTSKRTGEDERQRKVIGCFDIAGMKNVPGWGNMLHAGDLKLRVTSIKQAPLFWDFHQYQGEKPFWGSGLFRYLPDAEARHLLDALSSLSSGHK